MPVSAVETSEGVAGTGEWGDGVITPSGPSGATMKMESGACLGLSGEAMTLAGSHFHERVHQE